MTAKAAPRVRTNGRFPKGWDQWSPGDRVLVFGKRTRRRYPGEIAGIYPGGVTVFLDGVPGMGRAHLYADLKRETGNEQPAQEADEP